MSLNLVLLEPEIPANTGTIGRSCVLTGTSLHLIAPLGFSLDDSMLRRAGMGYWRDLDVHIYKDYAEFCALHRQEDPWLCTVKATRYYHEVSYSDGDYIMLGKESSGINDAILNAHPSRCIRIPMLKRSINPHTHIQGPISDPADPYAVSLNLSNAANIVLYEALVQLNFPFLNS